MIRVYPYSGKKILFAGWLIIAWHCNKKFDEPPVYTGAEMRPTISIRQLRSMHFAGSFEKIPDEHVIGGVVAANDSSDNFYKTIVIQDSTAGISIKMDGTGLYHKYPVGMKVFVRLKDLWLGDYAGMVQLGGGVDRTDPLYPDIISIPQPLFGRHIIKGGLGNSITPLQVGIDQLNDSLQSRLIMLTGVEMPASDTGRPYADVQNRVSVNRAIQSCNGQKAYIRTSGFAGFANIKTPRGNGSIQAVYSVFNNDRQLLIRDTSDIDMHGLRCTGNGAKTLLTENFESTTATEPLGKGWKTITEAGNIGFQQKQSGGNRYAEITAFASGQNTVVAWLVSPPVNLSASSDEILQFVTKDGFDNGAVLQVMISANYDGGSTPWKAKWAPLKATVSKGSVNGIAGSWVVSGPLGLNSYQGKVYIAFRYEGADPVNMVDRRTTSFQVDNISIMGN